MNKNHEDVSPSGQREPSPEDQGVGSAGASPPRFEIDPPRSIDTPRDIVDSNHKPDEPFVASANYRKHPKHGVYVSPIKPTIVYLTVCCKDRTPWLATERHHEHLLRVWQDSSHWVVGQYVLMPDHLHLFAAPQENAVIFDAWVRYFKSQFTKRNRNPHCVWQADHWDTRIRGPEHYEEKSLYMLNNPVRAELADTPQAWKYQGVVHDLRWD